MQTNKDPRLPNKHAKAIFVIESTKLRYQKDVLIAFMIVDDDCLWNLAFAYIGLGTRTDENVPK